MKAGQWDATLGRIVINEIPRPKPGPGQLLIKISSASLCLSDLLAIERHKSQEPLTIGHEACGIVAGFHHDTEDKGFTEGDLVGFLPVNGSCFECEGCQIHNTVCLRGNPQIAGFGTPGFFAEYALLDWQNAILLPKHWDPRRSSPFFCAGVTGK